jgi:hypothetical protein
MAVIFVPCANCIQCSIAFRYMNRDLSNVIALDYGSVPTAEQVEEVAADVLAAVVDNVMPAMNEMVTLLRVDARSLANQEAPIASQMPNGDVTGGFVPSGGVDWGNSQSALVLTLRTATPGRSGRGRIYVGGVVGSTVDYNYALTAWADAVWDGWRGFREQVETAGAGVMSVLSRFHDGAPREAGLLRHVTDIQLRNKRIDSQRRRMPRD